MGRTGPIQCSTAGYYSTSRYMFAFVPWFWLVPSHDYSCLIHIRCDKTGGPGCSAMQKGGGDACASPPPFCMAFQYYFFGFTTVIVSDDGYCLE